MQFFRVYVRIYSTDEAFSEATLLGLPFSPPLKIVTSFGYLLQVENNQYFSTLET